MVQQVALLVSKGVPYAEAMKWSPARRFAWIVAVGEIQGGTFDWARMQWQERD